MIRQTTESTETPGRGVGQGVSEVFHDIVSLTELQGELLKVDAKEAAGRVLAPLVLFAAAGALALGTIPVLLLLMASALLAAGLALWLALLIAVVIGFVAAALIALAGREMLRRPFRAFQRSRDEFVRNVDWLKRTLARQETADRDET
jgi:hypothetical protein